MRVSVLLFLLALSAAYAGEGSDPVILLGSISAGSTDSTAAVQFAVTEGGSLTLGLFDLDGEVIALITDGFWPAGNHIVEFEVGDMETGVYVIRLDAMGETLSRRCLLFR